MSQSARAQEAIGRAEWVAGLPEFCHVLDLSASRYSPQEFLDKFVMASRPVVLRGLPELTDVFPAGQMFRTLVKEYGERIITSWAAPHGRFWGKEESDGVEAPARPARVPLSMKNLINILQMNATEMGAFVYGEHINLEREVPELAERLVQAHLASGPHLLAALPFRRVNLWLAPMEEEFQDTLHWDAHDSLSYQMECAKEFLLFPPGDRDKLPYDVEGPEDNPQGLEWHANLGRGGRHSEVHWHLGSARQRSRAAAAIDLSRPKEELAKRFPKLAEALPPKKCTVHSGEALYIPAHWHKQVHFFGGAGAGTRCKCLNGAVDFWYRPLTTDKQSAVAAAKSLKEEL